jgi:hypothetical protein
MPDALVFCNSVPELLKGIKLKKLISAVPNSFAIDFSQTYNFASSNCKNLFPMS